MKRKWSNLLVVIGMALILVSCVREASSQADPAISGQWKAGGTSVIRIHDRKHGVICYVSDGYNSGGISCLGGGYSP